MMATRRLTILRPMQNRQFFSWFQKKEEEKCATVSEDLRRIYRKKLLPAEDLFNFHDFHSPPIEDAEFFAKPMVLLVGQYSTGKTTFIRYLLGSDFSGMRIGPEPTTDRFITIMHGPENGFIPGNALVMDAKKQFRPLGNYGNSFLNRFQCSTLKNPVLESISLVDTPGILSGEKQRIDRGYDFTGILEWFAGRVDRIILLFDAHKLDISDEFRRCLESLTGNEDKIRIVLNKSDMVDHQQLMRVYGALMWSLGKIFKTPEVSRVYVGSFWDQPLHFDTNRRLFQDEQQDLFDDLQSLPRSSTLRKLNDLVKRARLVRAHAHVMNELAHRMPKFIGKDRKRVELIQELDKIYEHLAKVHKISPGDFPDVEKMKSQLWNLGFSEVEHGKCRELEMLEDMLSNDIARLMSQIPQERASQSEGASVIGGAFTQSSHPETPFSPGKGEGIDVGANENEWVVKMENETFSSLLPENGRLNGRIVKEYMIKWTKLPNFVLAKVWKLSDVDGDGQLDLEEFSLAMHLIQLKLDGHELPEHLPEHLVPPSKRPKILEFPEKIDNNNNSENS